MNIKIQNHQTAHNIKIPLHGTSIPTIIHNLTTNLTKNCECLVITVTQRPTERAREKSPKTTKNKIRSIKITLPAVMDMIRWSPSSNNSSSSRSSFPTGKVTIAVWPASVVGTRRAVQCPALGSFTTFFFFDFAQMIVTDMKKWLKIVVLASNPSVVMIQCQRTHWLVPVFLLCCWFTFWCSGTVLIAQKPGDDQSEEEYKQSQFQQLIRRGNPFQSQSELDDADRKQHRRRAPNKRHRWHRRRHTKG